MSKFEVGSLQHWDAVKDQIIVEGLRWWHEDQNNSGGYFIRNERVDHDIFAQAGSIRVAESMLREAVAYDSDNWCACCGERFYISLWNEEGTEEPRKYTGNLSEGYKELWGGGAILYLQSGLVLRTIDGKMYEVLRYE
jgi:hypothetical protein